MTAIRKFGLIGFPLSHSFSQNYFTEKFQREGLKDCVYENFPLQSIYELKDVLRGNTGLEGLNVTIPFKQLVIRHLDNAGTLPIRACNCIRIRNGKTTGYNTDIIGFERSLLNGLRPYHQKALILGNGGAAEAVREGVSDVHRCPADLAEYERRVGAIRARLHEPVFGALWAEGRALTAEQRCP